MNDSKNVLQLEELSKQYGRRTAVDDLSFEVLRGDVFGFIGQNGAGKSTTIRMILGLVRPTSGSIRLLGHDVVDERHAALRRVGAIVEAPAFYEDFSGRENLRILAAMSGGVPRKRIDEVLDIVGLRYRADDPVRVYSHGMRQRLGIAQALVPDPAFIILDEPTDGLDPQGIREVRTLIRSLRDEMGLTVLLSSHLLYEVEQICNRVAIIDRGKLLYQGTLDGLVSREKTVKLTVDRPDDAFAFLASDPSLVVSRNGEQSLYITMTDEQIPALNRLLVEHGFQVSELSPSRETLEHVFLRLTAKGGASRQRLRK